MPSLIFLVALIGEFFDWRYRRRGGAKPTKRQNLLLAAAVAVCVLTVVLFALAGAPAYEMGQLSALLIILILGLWELWRWIIRRGNPIARA